MYDCQFSGVEWNTDDEMATKTSSQLQRFWAKLSIKAAVAKSMLNLYFENNPNPPPETETVGTKNGNHTVNRHLLGENVMVKNYKPLLQRNTGLSLEEALGNMEKRKRRKLESESKNVQSDN